MGMLDKIVSLNPFRCRMWSLHDRLETEVTEEACRIEIDSFSRHGQRVPTLGRALRGEPDFDAELIYGARRLFVARHLNKPLLVELTELSDLDAIIAMDIENRQRADISPYERGRSFLRSLRGGHFKSQEEIAKVLKISASQVSRLIKLAQLPSAIVAAFGSPADICEMWGLALYDALESPPRRSAIIQRARVIAYEKERRPTRDIYQDLIAAGSLGKRKLKPRAHDEVVSDAAGKPLFRIRYQTSAVTLVLPRQRLSETALERIRSGVLEIIREEPSHWAVVGSESEVRASSGGRTLHR
jgi:ParB family chromosome partitioning protein